MANIWIVRIVFVLLVGGFGFYQNHLLQKEKTAHKQTIEANAQKLNNIWKLNLETQVRVAELAAAKQQTVEVIRTKYIKVKDEIKKTEQATRDLVDSGAASMYINASCERTGSGQADSSDVSYSPTTATGADGGTLRLTARAGEGYWNLRTGIKANREQVYGLQAYIKKVCLNQ